MYLIWNVLKKNRIKMRMKSCNAIINNNCVNMKQKRVFQRKEHIAHANTPFHCWDERVKLGFPVRIKPLQPMSLNNKIVVVAPYFMLRHTPETYILCKKVQHILQIPIPILESPKNTRIELKFLYISCTQSFDDWFVYYVQNTTV